MDSLRLEIDHVPRERPTHRPVKLESPDLPRIELWRKPNSSTWIGVLTYHTVRHFGLGPNFCSDEYSQVWQRLMEGFYSCRENCQCSQCTNQETKQRMVDTFSVSHQVRYKKTGELTMAVDTWWCQYTPAGYQLWLKGRHYQLYEPTTPPRSVYYLKIQGRMAILAFTLSPGFQHIAFRISIRNPFLCLFISGKLVRCLIENQSYVSAFP